MLRPPPIDSFVLQEVLYRVGFALWQIQELESVLTYYLVMVHKLEPGIAQEEAEAVFEKTRKKTFGQLLGELKGQDTVRSDLVQRLDNFVEHRNWLAHRSRGESREEVYQAHRNQELFARLDWIAKEALAIGRLLLSEHTDHLKSHGVDMIVVEKLAAATMERWQKG